MTDHAPLLLRMAFVPFYRELQRLLEDWEDTDAGERAPADMRRDLRRTMLRHTKAITVAIGEEDKS